MSTFKSYKSDAWEDPEINRRYEADAWTDCEFAKRYISDAWEEVWTAIKWMKVINDTLISGTIAGHITNTSDGQEGWGIWYFDGGDNGGGSATYYVEGDFTNPSISFDYDGFFGYTPGGTYTQAQVGKIDVYTRTTSGTESYTSAVSAVKVPDGYESYSTTLSGNFDRVGFRFTFMNWGSGTDSYGPQYLFNIYNILIDGKRSLPGEDCVHA